MCWTSRMCLSKASDKSFCDCNNHSLILSWTNHASSVRHCTARRWADPKQQDVCKTLVSETVVKSYQPLHHSAVVLSHSCSDIVPEQLQRTHNVSMSVSRSLCIQKLLSQVRIKLCSEQAKPLKELHDSGTHVSLYLQINPIIFTGYTFTPKQIL